MPLSEYEQRVLEALERDLGQDPKLKSAMTRAPRSAARIALSGVGVLLGLGVVLGGVMAKVWIVGIAGFGLMIIAALWGLLGGGSSRGASAPTVATAKGKKSRQGFMTRLEERFEKRREEGEL